MITLWATFTSNGGYFSFQHLVTLMRMVVVRFNETFAALVIRNDANNNKMRLIP